MVQKDRPSCSYGPEEERFSESNACIPTSTSDQPAVALAVGNWSAINSTAICSGVPSYQDDMSVGNSLVHHMETALSIREPRPTHSKAVQKASAAKVRITWPHCQERMLKKVLSRHIKSVHALEEEKPTCTLCDKTFKRQDILSRHQHEQHSAIEFNLGRVECARCGGSVHKRALRDHLRSRKCKAAHGNPAPGPVGNGDMGMPLSSSGFRILHSGTDGLVVTALFYLNVFVVQSIVCVGLSIPREMAKVLLVDPGLPNEVFGQISDLRQRALHLAGQSPRGRERALFLYLSDSATFGPNSKEARVHQGYLLWQSFEAQSASGVWSVITETGSQRLWARWLRFSPYLVLLGTDPIEKVKIIHTSRSTFRIQHDLNIIERIGCAFAKLAALRIGELANKDQESIEAGLGRLAKGTFAAQLQWQD